MEKPTYKYKDGDKVSFNFGGSEGKGTGVIRGIGMDGLVPFWIVEMHSTQGIDPEWYPFRCALVSDYAVKALEENDELFGGRLDSLP